MRNIAFIVSLLLLTASCIDNRRTCQVSGTGVGADDTLYLFGLDRRYEYVDTIVADKTGNYKHKVAIDTISPMSLLMPSGEDIVLFAEPNKTIEITPDSIRKGCWTVQAGAMQQLYDSMAALIEPLGNIGRHEAVERFIQSDPLNEAGIILMRRYLIESSDPLTRNIRDIINKFGGRLQDNDYLAEYKKTIEQKRSISNIHHSSVPLFDYIAMDDSTKLNNKRYKEKYWVINFWASWDTLSRNHVKAISKACKSRDAEYLTMLNISLDHDTAEWRKAVIADSLTGDNVCDRKMWANTLVKRYDVNTLPYSVLVNPQLLNVEYNITADKFEASIDSLIKKHKENKIKAEKLRKKKK